MKRLLLTFLTMLAAALPVVASAPVLAFSESEITLAPGESQEVHIVLQSLDETINAMQLQFLMYDQNRSPINTVYLDKCYGGSWIIQEGLSTNTNNSAASNKPETGAYRLLCTNTWSGVYWPLEDFSGPGNVFAFTIKADAGWNDEYATFELDLDYSLFACPSGHYTQTEPLVLKVKNSLYELPLTVSPVIEVEHLGGERVITMYGSEDAVIYYRINKDNNGWGEWTQFTGVFYLTEPGYYLIEAYAIAEGLLASDLVTVSCEVPQLQTPQPELIYVINNDAAIVEAFGEGEVKLYMDGAQVENPCTVLRTNVDQYYTFSATAKGDGMLISDPTTMQVKVPAKEGLSDGISIYVKALQAPYLYAWNANGSLCGDWPGTRLTETAVINREDYYIYHFDENMVNVIFNDGYGNQTGDFTNITEDAFFIYNGQDLAYGLIPPEVYGNPTGEYAFYVNTDNWSQVNAVVDGNTYPMEKIGVDGAGFEVYKWQASSLDYSPSTITFNDGNGHGVQDAMGYTYSSDYVRGGYYVYSFYLNYQLVRLDRVTTISFEDDTQRPVIENCAATLLSSNEEWNSLSNISFRITGTYFSQAARQGSVFYSVDGGSWIEFASQLSSEQAFGAMVNLSFNQWMTHHTIRLMAQDWSGARSETITVLEATDASTLECSNLPEVEYTGQAITFSPVIQDANGNELIMDEDYISSFSNNVNAGNAELNIQAMYPRYIGQKTIYFTINPHAISGEVFFSDGEDQFLYTGNPITPEVTVVDAIFGTLTMNRDYVVSYINNVEVGQAFAIIEGIGNFGGRIELPFEILNLIYGDVNYSNTIDIADLQAMVKYIFGEYNKPFNSLAADLNQDNKVNVQDVVGEAQILLTGDLLSSSFNGQRMTFNGNAAQARLYWADGVLYLESNVPVAAIDIVNDVEGDIRWSLNNQNMVIMNAVGAQGNHTVIFSLDNAVIPSGLTAIATTDSKYQSVVAAKLSDTDAELIAVELNDELTSLTSISTDNEVSCRVDGTTLIINSDTSLPNLDIAVYTIDGRIIANKHLSLQANECAGIEMKDQLDNNSYFIVVVRNGRRVILTQKLTQNK